jgi:hypothetical protein
LRRGDGSTARADVIAAPDERAGIKCYLINGVCHQAANRILLPAGITARGALGYDVSEAMFGTYGRPRGPFGLCSAPFHQHPEVTGDLPECGPGPAVSKSTRGATRSPAVKARRASVRERKYLDGVLAIYDKAESALPKGRGAPAERDLEGFHVELFMHKLDYDLGSKAGRRLLRKLEDIRRSTERSRIKIEEWFLRGEMNSDEFVEAFDRETMLFQEAAASAMTAAEYRAVFRVPRGRLFVLADKRVARTALASAVRSTSAPE